MDVLQNLSPAFRNYAMAPEDPNGHSITVTAPSVVLERIISDIKAMDIKPYQVLLEARIVAMEKGDLLNLGVEWGWPTVSAGTYTNNNRGVGSALDLAGKTAWGIQMGYTPDAGFTNALDAVLNAMKSNNQAKILAKPAVMAKDGSIADIRVLREDYYILYATGLQENIYNRQEMEKITTGTVLAITPHISNSEDIVLEVAVEVSDTIPQSNDSGLPSVTRRIAKSTVRVYDGGTVAIAGLSEDRKMQTTKAVPGLSAIPLIGGLFKNNYHNYNNREVAIFITASIVNESSQLNQSNQQQLGFTNRTTSAPAPSPMSEDIYRVESDNTNNATRRTTSNFDNNTSLSQEDMFMGFPDTDNQNNGSRRTSTPASLSPEDAFNRQLDNRLATQGGRSGRSEY
jgi:general secretion pathway protein D